MAAEAVVIGALELDRVTGLVVDQSRKLAVHRWPGANGDMVQDMGMAAGRIHLTGVAMGPDAGARLEQLRTAMQSGKPQDFVASAAVASGIEQVIIAGLRVTQPPGRTEYFEYQVDLVHYVPPPPPLTAGFDPAALAGIAADLEASARSAVDDMAAAAGDIIGKVEKALEAIQGLGIIAEVLAAAGAVVTSHEESKED
jgi:hypothetical protein